MIATYANPPRRLLYVVNEDWAFLLNCLPMARAAQKAGFEVHVATRVKDGARDIETEGFTLHPIPLQRGGISPLSAIPAILALRQITGRIKPDIGHHSGLQCCVYGSIAAFGRKFPYVSALTGMGYVYTSATWRARFLKAILKWQLPSLLGRPGDIVLVQNPDDRAALADLGIKHERIVLIPGSGVDTDALQPLPEPEEPITYGFAGRLLTDKGIRALVAAHDIVRGQGLGNKPAHCRQSRPGQSRIGLVAGSQRVDKAPRNYVARPPQGYLVAVEAVSFRDPAFAPRRPTRKFDGSGRLWARDDRNRRAGMP